MDNIKIDELKDGATYTISFPEKWDMEQVERMVKNINKYLEEKGRNIVFIYMPDTVEIKGAN